MWWLNECCSTHNLVLYTCTSNHYTWLNYKDYVKIMLNLVKSSGRSTTTVHDAYVLCTYAILEFLCELSFKYLLCYYLLHTLASRFMCNGALDRGGLGASYNTGYVHGDQSC